MSHHPPFARSFAAPLLVLIGLASTVSADTEDMAPSAVRPTSADTENRTQNATYGASIERAVAAFAAKNFEAAAAHFAQAHLTFPSARTLRGMGMMAFELRHYEDALSHLQASLRDPRRPLQPSQRAAVEDLVERTLSFLGIFELTVTPDNAEVRVDGEPAIFHGGAIWLRVGPREVSISAPGHADQVIRLEVLGQERIARTVHLERLTRDQVEAGPTAVASPSQTQPVLADRSTPLEPTTTGSFEPPAPSPGGSGSWAPWLAVGAGGVMVASSIVTGLLAQTTETDLQRLCGKDGCSAGDLKDANALQHRGEGLALATDVLLFGGLGVAGAGLLYWLLDAPEERDPTLSGALICLTDRCHGTVRTHF